MLARKSIRTSLRCSRVGMVEAAQDRGRAHAAAPRLARCLGRTGLGDPLRRALVRSVTVGVARVLDQDPTQVALARDEDMVEALAADAPEEPLAGGVLRGLSLGTIPRHTVQNNIGRVQIE